MTFHKKIRAMDRRRFVPSTEGLEGRELMAGVNTLFGIQVTTNLNVPITLQQKEKRIEHLPYYLEQIRPGRFLPKTEIEEIQSALFNMIDSIDKPRTDALNNFNYQLRKVVSKQSLTAGDIAVLNHGVSAVLQFRTRSSGIDRRHLEWAVHADLAGRHGQRPAGRFWEPMTTRSCSQTALAIGRPMPPPQLPRIKKNNGIQANANHIKTPLERPTLVGTYHYHTIIQVVTPAGRRGGRSQLPQEQQLRGPDHDAAERGHPRVPASSGRRRRPSSAASASRS